MSMRRGNHPGRPPGIEAVGRGYGAGKPFFVEPMVVCSSPGASCSSHGAGEPLVGNTSKTRALGLFHLARDSCNIEEDASQIFGVPKSKRLFFFLL